MDVVGPLFGAAEWLMRDAALFAAAGFLLLGLGDLAIDLLWMMLRLKRLGGRMATVGDLPPPERPGRLAVFVPAWDEAGVIGPMLRASLAAWAGADLRLYVGCYPNDPATLAEVRSLADPRLRPVLVGRPGPTTKADCLNALWRALIADEAAEGCRAKAVVLHDAEDVVHSAEPAIFDSLVERFDLVQLPVVPLIGLRARWIGGHYADEFAESHAKEMVVRAWLGAALPSAGVGCAFSREALERVAAAQGGLPFDAASLTEDYELGLRIRAQGGSAAFVRIRQGRGLVATREHFPGTLAGAVNQKARWMTGIGLAGWDRLGWSGGLAERWMRLRDRQSLLAALLLLAGYAAFFLWFALHAAQAGLELAPAPFPPLLALLVQINLGVLLWRLALRAGFTAYLYGWREGAFAIPRAAVGNVVAILAAAAALSRYKALRRTGRPQWGKTDHVFPAELPAE